MNIYEVFSKDYLTATDLGGQELTTTIKRVRLEALNGKEQRCVADLQGQDRPLLLNRTLAHTISALHGAETDNWVGKTITLYPEAKKWGNDILHTIRIQTPAAGQQGEQQEQQAPTKAARKGKRA